MNLSTRVCVSFVILGLGMSSSHDRACKLKWENRAYEKLIKFLAHRATEARCDLLLSLCFLSSFFSYLFLSRSRSLRVSVDQLLSSELGRVKKFSTLLFHSLRKFSGIERETKSLPTALPTAKLYRLTREGICSADDSSLSKTLRKFPVNIFFLISFIWELNDDRKFFWNKFQ